MKDSDPFVNFVMTYSTVLNIPTFFVLITGTFFIIAWFFGMDVYDWFDDLFDDSDTMTFNLIAYTVGIFSLFISVVWNFYNPFTVALNVLLAVYLGTMFLLVGIDQFMNAARYFRAKRGKNVY